MKTVDRWTNCVAYFLLASLLALCAYMAAVPIDEPPAEMGASAQTTATVAPAPPVFTDTRSVVDWVNRAVNRGIVYQTDMAQYGVADFWVSHPRSGRGDCEDYAITKIAELTNAGMDIANIRISGLDVFVNGKHVGRHAVAIWTDANGREWLLDNGYDNLMSKDLMVAGFNGTRYRFLW